MTTSREPPSSRLYDEPAAFLIDYPEYAGTRVLDDLRASEYAYLDEQDHVYLDYTGAGLAAISQWRTHVNRLRGNVFGNPHSVNPSSRASTELVESARARVLRHFNAAPDDYVVIFTANATAAARMVGEAYPFSRKRRLLLTFDNHSSIVGLREFARRRHARTEYIASVPPELRVPRESVRMALARGQGLFAYPAQSNFTGVQHSLDWVGMAQDQGYDVLLDCAAFLPTNVLDLSVVRPQFVIASWYKVFGYPTGVGVLVARRDALAELQRPWFAGGTIRAASVQGDWHTMAPAETAFEDGTVNFLAIPDVEAGLDWVAGIGVPNIGRRVRCLTGWFLDQATSLRHTNGEPMVRLYGPGSTHARGGTIAFNLLTPDGDLVDERLVATESAQAGISLRTGCFCNPGAGENAFGLDPRLLRELGDSPAMTADDYIRFLGMPTAGAIRVSLGLASNVHDVDRFLAFVERTYRDRKPDTSKLPPRDWC
ncbi:Aminotransferase class V-fold PLP-dependent enzyme [Kibdelosporangium sp. 4NS15]|uniref:Aminotransferase class V-fold PLP-dependent enzyme n=1 Tax=Kibdelosporangium persicum TaxID=2698649 RepID=A0ABX2FHZ1_9PSEU|nr:aminotransferase class V-fold PLP-dependent enzyme [Kibdelosporangium persicum]NRN70724.1 Aminotransferase class V-fold PLP-dependent enzyme [Kibdelosporangium persicum]